MPKAHKPRSGSIQFWPRVRAKRIYANVKAWTDNKNKPLAFAGYKAGMTHVIETDIDPNSKNKNKQASTPVTIIECPPLKPFSLRFYRNTPYGSRVISEMFSKNLDKELSRKVTLPKKTKEENVPSSYDFIKLVVYTQPKLTGIGKKKPEIFEVGIPNSLDEAKKLLDKEIKVSELFKPGQYIDIHSITKGKGFQGPVKRFGVSLKSHKSEKKRRSAGNLGPFTPRRTFWMVPQHGQLGFFKRTEHNKLIYLISNDLIKVNQKGGIKGYGQVKNEYVLVKGSVGGPRKRLIIFTDNIRKRKETAQPQIVHVSTESKQ